MFFSKLTFCTYHTFEFRWRYMIYVARFGTICSIWNTWKTPMEVLLLLKFQPQAFNFTKSNTRVFSRFLNCTNDTKSCKASHICRQSYLGSSSVRDLAKWFHLSVWVPDANMFVKDNIWMKQRRGVSDFDF